MSWNITTLIVGFWNPISIISATNLLRQAPGFIQVGHLYRLTSAALVHVDPTEFDNFINTVLTFDAVEYCEYNYLVEPAAYHKLVNPAYSASTWSCADVRGIHKIKPDAKAGTGISIAMVDSGLCPHPYLPFTSFSESAQYIEFWPPYMRNNPVARSELPVLVDAETSLSPLSISALQILQAEFTQKARESLERLANAMWQGWYVDADKWHEDMLVYLAQQQGSINKVSNRPKIPSVPFYWSPLEFMRRINPQSRDFTKNSLNIEDTNGHGTQMAGLIVGKPPLSSLIQNASDRSLVASQEIDVLGIVPNAELVVLKCYDNSDLQSSNIDAVIRALEHAYDVGVDIVYVGVALSSIRIHPIKAITLDRTIRDLMQKNIAVVCPSGNDGFMELSMPAAVSIAVTAIDINKSITNYSNYATPPGEVAFAAFGGTEEHSVITTDKDFGFRRVYGTSVAAAIAVGVLAKALSSRYQIYADNDVVNFLNMTLDPNPSGVVLPPSSYKRRFISRRTVSLSTLLSAASARTDHSMIVGQFPSSHFGYGVIQEF